jgi:hypothetical protein
MKKNNILSETITMSDTSSISSASTSRLSSLNLTSASSTQSSVTVNGKQIDNDKRVRISMMSKSPNIFYKDTQNALLAPLATTNGVLFPFQPKIDLSFSANYDNQEVIHSNFAYKFYKNSEIKAIDISGNFIVKTAWEGLYVISAIHFLRCLTLMFTGNDSNVGGINMAGSPPLVVKLSGMGFNGLDSIPVAITNVTSSYPDNVDFLTIAVPALSGELVRVPTQSTISINCVPMFSRAYASAFGLKDFSYGTTRLLGPNPVFPTLTQNTLTTVTPTLITTAPETLQLSQDTSQLTTTATATSNNAGSTNTVLPNTSIPLQQDILLENIT